VYGDPEVLAALEDKIEADPDYNLPEGYKKDV